MIINRRGLLGFLGGLVLAARVKALPTEGLEEDEPCELERPAWKHHSVTWKHYSSDHQIDYTGESFAHAYERNVRVLLDQHLTAEKHSLYFNAKE